MQVIWIKVFQMLSYRVPYW